MKFDKPDIETSKDIDNNIIQRIKPRGASAAGTFRNDVDSQLLNKIKPITQEQVDNQPGYVWWAKDLEVYLPFIRGHVNGDGTDGGFKVFLFDSDSPNDIGGKFISAMKDGNDLEAPDDSRKDNIKGENVLKEFDGRRAWLPQLEDTQQTNVIAKNRVIISHAMEDAIGQDPDGKFITLPQNFFEPAIYNYNNVDLKRGFDQYGLQETYGNMSGILTADDNNNNSEHKIHKPGDQSTKTFNDCIKVSTINLGDRVRTRNSVMPYVKGILNNEGNYHLNGGYLHASTTDRDKDINGKAEIFNGEDRVYDEYAYNVDTAFNRSVADFNENSISPGQSFYIVALQISNLANEAVGDDATDSNWYYVSIDKQTIRDFLNNKDAMYIMFHQTFHNKGPDAFNNITPGIYDAQKNKLQTFARGKITGGSFATNPQHYGGPGQYAVGPREDNLGKGDEKDGYISDDKRAPRGKFYEIVICFRKPNPTNEDENVLTYPGSYDKINFEQSNPNLLNNQNGEIQKYIDMSQTEDQGFLDYNTNKNFGLFLDNKPIPNTNFLNYTPIPVTYNITDDVATLNQTYWDDDSIEAIEAGAPGRVGVSIDIEKDSTILDPNQLNKVLYNTFDQIDQYHFVDQNNIGYKYAVLSYGDNETLDELESAESLLDNLTISNGAAQLAMRDNIFRFEDVFMYNETTFENEYNTQSKTIIEPGLKVLYSVVFSYHLRSDNTILPLNWFLCESRYFLGFKDYFIEDFSEVGGPGFTVFPWPLTTPIVSGLSQSSKYLRSLDDIADADKFTMFQVIDRSRVVKALANDQLGNFIGDSDIGQTRVFDKPLRMSQMLNVPLIDDDILYYWDNKSFYDGQGNVGDSQTQGTYPEDSIATAVFISDTNSPLLKNCLVEINPGEQTNNLHRDSSGNGNKGILIGDFRLSKRDKDSDLVREGVMKVPKIGVTNRAF